MSDTLRLPIIKKYYDMIFDEVKPEEYRKIKPHWISRILKQFSFDENKYFIKLNNGSYEAKPFKYVEFINGYSPKSPRFTIECKGIEIREGNTEWGAVEGEKYFVIKLGKIIKQ